MKQMFILVNDMSCKSLPNYIWYVCELGIYHNPESSWLLQTTQSLKKKDAIQFCESKAKQIAKILSNQIDEEGYSSKWIIEKVQ